MTTVTKIFVILVCLFAFIFTPMAISFAARSYNWKALAQSYLNTAEVADARARNEKALRAAERERLSAILDQSQARVTEAEKRINDLQLQIDSLTQERDQLARSEESWRDSAALLTAEMSVLSKHNEELEGAREECLTRERELLATNIWLKDQLQTRTAELEVLRQQLNQRQQELVAFREENENLRRQLGIGRAGQVPTATPGESFEPISPSATSPIQGRVTEVRGKDASIDVGAASGVKQGMRMVVTRGNSYIGDLRIVETTPNEAVGEILAAGDRQVKPGDAVVDEVSFNTR